VGVLTMIGTGMGNAGPGGLDSQKREIGARTAGERVMEQRSDEQRKAASRECKENMEQGGQKRGGRTEEREERVDKRALAKNRRGGSANEAGRRLVNEQNGEV
jgi:hypothetical protein